MRNIRVVKKKKKIDVHPFTREEVAILKREERFERIEERLLDLEQRMDYASKPGGWKSIVGVDDSEDIELNKNEIESLINISELRLGNSQESPLMTTLGTLTHEEWKILKSKLSKMLKEKE